VDALFSSPATGRPTARGAGALGYRQSSYELQAGLEVRCISLMALPAEVVTELLRMRSSWGDGIAPTGPGAPT